MIFRQGVVRAVSNAYYQDELRYLREVGPEFARANPEIAGLLADPGADPDVQRLLEGVAFLCGRIRQKLDDELPELTANMMSLLWPHYLRPVPSMSILELLPEVEAMQAPFQMNAGAAFASVPVDGTRCRYRACWSEKLRPWTIENVRLETEAARPVRLILRLRTSAQTELAQLELDSIRLHLAGDPRTAFILYLLLCAHVEHITVSDGSSAHNRPEARLGPEHVRPAGLNRDAAVLPYPPYSFPGYRLIQEYFAFKERFLFVEVTGVDRAVGRLELTNALELTFTFNRRMEMLPIVGRENVRLHCVPIINLFMHHADPITVTHDRTQYLVHPAKSGVADRWHVEVFSVDEVSSVVHAETVEQRRYEPFYSFRHMGTTDPRKATYYQAHVVPNVAGGGPRMGTDTYLSFVVGDSSTRLAAQERVSVELTCTNRNLPASLRAGDVQEPTDSSPPACRFRNLQKPTLTTSPPLGRALHWRLISHMALNYVSLTDVTHFRELLRVYDFQAEADAQRALAQQRLLDGIVDVRSSFHERLIRGAPVRGTAVEVELNEDHFAGEGDAYLFSTILDRFLGLYVTLNSYSQLTVRFTRSGQRYSFAPRWGEQLTPAPARMGA